MVRNLVKSGCEQERRFHKPEPKGGNLSGQKETISIFHFIDKLFESFFFLCLVALVEATPSIFVVAVCCRLPIEEFVSDC